MIKKLGVVTVGVAAGLMAAAPFASATEGGHGHDHEGSGSCNINGGNAEANGGIDGDAAVGALAQAPVGANALNIVCSDVLNDNLSGNTLDIGIGNALPEVPIELPAAPEAAAPEAETPEAETPEAETPEAETPEAETPEAETPEAETPEVPEAETPVEIPGAV
ncbi:hypothetical protein ACFPK1_03355 [Actinomycetospora rhizophila]|uniref:Small secreted domain DUF320 n=1 Tax=Actinomycetospora rhizophila TaxID=1416876 RepID=A0ABV9Z9M6_9PSEU